MAAEREVASRLETKRGEERNGTRKIMSRIVDRLKDELQRLHNFNGKALLPSRRLVRDICCYV